MTTIITASAGKTGWREWSASIIHGLHTGDHVRIEDVHREWDGSQTWTPNRQFVDRLFTFAGYPPTYPPLDMGGASHQQIAQRWHSLITALVNGRAS